MRATTIPERLRHSWQLWRGRRRQPPAAPAGARRRGQQPPAAPAGVSAAERLAALVARVRTALAGPRREAVAAWHRTGPVLARLRRSGTARYESAVRRLRAVPWHRAADRIRALVRQLRYDPELDHTRTRQQRVAARGRRLEVLGTGGAVALCVLLVAVAPTPGGASGEGGAAADSADGTDQPDAADPPAGGLPRSEPTRLRIPQLGADVEVFGAELDPDGGPPTPDEEDAHRAAWHAGGVAPGEPGAALVVGHLDTDDGPAAFAGLATLEPGDTIEVTREDGTTAAFVLDEVAQYAKDDFPDEQVYGAVDSPQLRLITCGGQWTADGGYDANVVAYASLAGAPADAGTDAEGTEPAEGADVGEDAEPVEPAEEPAGADEVEAPANDGAVEFDEWDGWGEWDSWDFDAVTGWDDAAPARALGAPGGGG